MIQQQLENALLCGDAEIVCLRWMGDPTISLIGNVGSTPPPPLQLWGGTSAYKKVLSAQWVWLKTLMFNVYDTSISNGATGPLKDIQDSLSLPNDAFVQTRFKGAAMFDYQPNYFNPTFRVNGLDILDSDPGAPVGMPIPFHLGDLFKPLAQGGQKISSIEAYGRAAQDVNGQFVIYPAFCFAIFILMNSDPSKRNLLRT